MLGQESGQMKVGLIIHSSQMEMLRIVKFKSQCMNKNGFVTFGL